MQKNPTKSSGTGGLSTLTVPGVERTFWHLYPEKVSRGWGRVTHLAEEGGGGGVPPVSGTILKKIWVN